MFSSLIADKIADFLGWWRVRSQSKIVNGVHNCERRSQNHQNELEFYASNHFLTISFLLQNHPSQPQSLLPLFARSACISKNFLKTIVNAVHKIVFKATEKMELNDFRVEVLSLTPDMSCVAFNDI